MQTEEMQGTIDGEEMRSDAPLALRQDTMPARPPAQQHRTSQGQKPGPVESRVRQTPEASDLMMAFARAQMQFPVIQKNKTANITGQRSYSYRYADLADVLTAINPVLKAHGLAFMTIPTRGVLVGRLIHEPTGQWIEGDLSIVPPDVRGGVQALGSAITYERRYLVASMLGLVLEEDDDGNAADGHQASTGYGNGYRRGS